MTVRGFIEEIGFDLYCRLLEEAVGEIKHKGPSPEKIEMKILTDLDLYLPESYVEDQNLRVDLYRSISDIRDTERLNAFVDELKDRFGAFPEAVENLINLAEARIIASKLGVERLAFKNGDITLEFIKNRIFNKAEIEGWHRRIQAKMEFKSYEGFKVQIKLNDRRSLALKKTLQALLA